MSHAGAVCPLPTLQGQTRHVIQCQSLRPHRRRYSFHHSAFSLDAFFRHGSADAAASFPYAFDACRATCHFFPKLQQAQPSAPILPMSQLPQPLFPVPSLAGIHMAPCEADALSCFIPISPLSISQQAQLPFSIFSAAPIFVGSLGESECVYAVVAQPEMAATSAPTIKRGENLNVFIGTFYFD